MSRSGSNGRQPAGQGPSVTSHPTPGARSTRTISLLVLVLTVAVVAVTMVVSLVEFVLRPNPAVKAGPMYVTLTMTTIALLFMVILALNASFLRLLTRQRARDLSLVTWALGVTGVLTGMLTLGNAVSSIVTRFVVASIAFAFIAIQDARLAKARSAALAAAPASAPAGRVAAPTQQAQTQRGRQRRGGRKR
jgi:hypothetical protein